MPADSTHEVWSIPPELERPLPRPVRLSGIGITYCVMAMVAILFGAGMSFRIVHDELHRQAEDDSVARRLSAEGQETEATVIKLFTGLGYVVNYQYFVNGRTYERGAFITQEHWQALQVGAPLAVRYLPSDPNRAYPDADPPNSEKHWSSSLPMAGLILLFMLIFATIYVSPILPKRRLLARGRPARGVVTDCKAGSQGRSSGYFLSYEFPLIEGGHCTGKVFSGQHMVEGTTVTVLYNPDRPQCNALYPMKLVRLATL